jgi:hypothetical protein
LPVLLQAYLKVLGPEEKKPLSSSPVVPLADLYAVISPTPEQSLKYLREEFTRDIYFLHRSGHNATRSGIQVSFPISRGVRGKNLTINDENGTQLCYYGVRFCRPQPTANDLPVTGDRPSKANPGSEPGSPAAVGPSGSRSDREQHLVEFSSD